MNELIKSLEGKKTYGLCAIGLALIAAFNLHWISIPQDQLNELTSLITLAAIAALRAGVSK